MSQSDIKADCQENAKPGAARGAAMGPKDWFLAAVLVAAVFLLYQPAWQGGFLWDDELHLLNNPVIRPGGLAKVWVPGGYLNYWPVTFTVYWLEFHLWGLKPLGYHLVNIALHALSALLVWRILARLQVPGALFAAAIFALHPVNVESVAWIAQLKGTLSLVLALVSVIFYLGHERQGGHWRYGLAVLAFLLSALAKGAALTLPIVLLSLAWWQRGRITRRDLLRALPYALIGAAMAGVEIWGQRLAANGEVVRSDGLFGRAAVAGCAVWFYLGKLIWPLDLCLVYPRWTIDGRSALSYLPGMTLVILLAWAWWRRRTWGRPVAMLIVCYVALLLPVLGFVNIYAMRYSLVADHWQYAAMVVPCATLSGVAAALARRFGRPPVAHLLCLGLLAALGILSCRQSRMYADAVALYQTTIAQNPNCSAMHNSLGLALANRGRVNEAIAEYERAVEIDPDDAVAHNNLGNVLAGRGQVDGAIAGYQRALEIAPNYAQAHFNLGNALFGRGQFDAAVAHYHRALEINPDYAKAQNNLANALVGVRRLDEAINEYRKALRINADDADTHYNLAYVLAGCGQFDEAIAQYRAALEIKPDDATARRGLAVALSDRERALKVLAKRREALHSRPSDVMFLNDTAWMLATNPNASIRRGADALGLAARASHLCGGHNPAVLDTLAAAYAEAGRFSDAARTAAEAARLATAAGDRTLAEKIRARLELYRGGRPYRQRSP
jgi:tetratricopeptide (TPR) repeat protein